MRIVSNSDHLAETISSCRNEAEKHFGDGHLLLEKYLLLILSYFSLRFLPRTRHIEIQVFGDAHGDVVQLGERECSLQRRYQKLIEESPCVSPFLSFHSSVLSNRRRTVASLLLGARSHAAEPLRGRSDRRIPLRRRHAPLLLHGGQHAPASRASRHAVRQPANRSRRTPATRFLSRIHRFLDRSGRISSRDRGFSVFHEAGSTIRRPHLQTWTPDRAFRHGMPRLQRRSRQVGSTFPRFWIVTFCREMGFRGYSTQFRTPTPESRTIFRPPPRQPPSTRFS